MSTPAASTPDISWILGPVTRCVGFIAEEAKNGGLLKRALAHLELAGPLLLLAAENLKAAQRTENLESINRIVAASPHNEQWARDLRLSDFAEINSHGLVAIWGALETCVEDTIVNILTHESGAVDHIERLGVRVKSNALDDSAGEERFRSAYRKLEDKCRVPGDIIATYEAELDTFGLSTIGCDRHVLNEANALRNCIVHRGGIVDARAAKQALALHAKVGQRYLVSTDNYLRYHDAIGGWAMALMKAILSSQYVKGKA